MHETYLYLTTVPKDEEEKRHMAQHGHITVGQKDDRRPRMRSCAPENVDLRRQGEEVIVIKNDFVRISERLLERSKSERTVSRERGSAADPEPERANIRRTRSSFERCTYRFGSHDGPLMTERNWSTSEEGASLRGRRYQEGPG
jgi:hypothetical protein